MVNGEPHILPSRQKRVPADFLFDLRLIADKNDLVSAVSRFDCFQAALHDRSRRIIPAHGVHCDTHILFSTFKIIAHAAKIRNARRNIHSSDKRDAAISAGGNWSTPPRSAQKVSNASAACHGGYENVFVSDLALLFLTFDEYETAILLIQKIRLHFG
jgi:hypothetical protein